MSRRPFQVIRRWLESFASAQGWFDRASIFRHVAICTAAVVAFLMRFDLAVGNEVLWIIGVVALLNLVSFLLAGHPAVGSVARVLSPVIGIGGWTALVHWTGGVVGSPFSVGFAFEILLAGRTFSTRGSLLATLGSLAALWGQQASLGYDGALAALGVQTGLIAAIGVIAVYLTRDWQRQRSELVLHSVALGERLRGLESDLDAARRVGAVGENVARLAHGLRNAVHSLRGFSDLLEHRLQNMDMDLSALRGLQSGIEQLERLVQFTLGVNEGEAHPQGVASAARLQEMIAEAIDDVKATHPDVRWIKVYDASTQGVRVPPEVVHEVLVELLRNAADALEGRGEVRVMTRLAGETLAIEVRDNGPGIAASDLGRIFERGFTTKAAGTGHGLFLARRLLETYGGAIAAAAAAGSGASFTLTFPLDGMRTTIALGAAEAKR